MTFITITGDRATVTLRGSLVNAHGGEMNPNATVTSRFDRASLGEWQYNGTFLPASLCRIAGEAVAREAERIHLSANGRGLATAAEPMAQADGDSEEGRP